MVGRKLYTSPFGCGMNKLLAAIVDDDVSAVKRLLRADAGLATQLIQKPKLHDSGIFQWIYAGDMAPASGGGANAV